MRIDQKNINYLKNIMTKVLDMCKVKKEIQIDGKTKTFYLRVPSGDMKYRSFWVRDAAMMAAGGKIPDDELAGWLELIMLVGQNGSKKIVLENGLCIPAFSIADHINFDGKPVYYPGTYDTGMNQGDGSFGFYPPHDNQYYFIEMAYIYFKQSKDVSFLNQINKGSTFMKCLERAFDYFNIDVKTQLCISRSPGYTVDWGFCDQITKTGHLLFPSLLRYRAALRLNELFSYLGNNNKKTGYLDIAKKIKKQIINKFYKEDGWFYSSTGISAQADVWGTSFAIWLDILEDQYKKDTLTVLAKGFLKGTAVKHGYVRHILEGNDHINEETAWESSGCKYNTYQNGGYWATPSGWYIYALSEFDWELAVDMITSFVEHTKNNETAGAPYEWISADGKVFDGKNYGASAALPYVALKRLTEK